MNRWDKARLAQDEWVTMAGWIYVLLAVVMPLHAHFEVRKLRAMKLAQEGSDESVG